MSPPPNSDDRVVLAVDPGIRGCGAALFAGGRLIECAYVASPCRGGERAAECATMASWVAGSYNGRYRVSELAVEWPRVYASRIRAGEAGADPNDLLALCGVNAALAALLAPAAASSYAPSEWKGQMKKGPSHLRVESRLGAEEREVYEAGSLGCRGHNVRDAVGIGLHHLGRLDRKRVIAR